jgi:hypothetical protein
MDPEPAASLNAELIGVRGFIAFIGLRCRRSTATSTHDV